MSAVERQLVNQLENMDIEGILSDFDLGDVPRRDEMKLQVKRQSLTITVPSDLWKEADGHDLSEPGCADVIYWEKLGVMMVALDGDFDV